MQYLSNRGALLWIKTFIPYYCRVFSDTCFTTYFFVFLLSMCTMVKKNNYLCIIKNLSFETLEVIVQKLTPEQTYGE